MEEWRYLNGLVKYGNNYEVSDKGRVRRLDNGKELTGCFDKDGYRITLLTHKGERRGYRIHRLVAIAFIDNPENKPEVNHIDGVKDNNEVSNLEWVTTSENQLHVFVVTPERRKEVQEHCRRVGKAFGAINGRKCRKPVVMFNYEGDVIGEYIGMKHASEKTGFHISTISWQCKYETMPAKPGPYFRLHSTLAKT